jgi:hypothetical protein
MNRNKFNKRNTSLNPLYESKGVELIIVNNGSKNETIHGIEECKARYTEMEIEYESPNNGKQWSAGFGA